VADQDPDRNETDEDPFTVGDSVLILDRGPTLVRSRWLDPSPFAFGPFLVSQARFQKQQREKARRERAEAKFARRAERSNSPAADPAEPVADQTVVLAELAALHERREAGEITFEEFEATKQQLTEQLDVR
jgi:hypothetical protein